MNSPNEQLRLRAVAFRAISQLCRGDPAGAAAIRQAPESGPDLAAKLWGFASNLSGPERQRLRLELATSFLIELDRHLRVEN
jgi:hypothetical protein